MRYIRGGEPTSSVSCSSVYVFAFTLLPLLYLYLYSRFLCTARFLCTVASRVSAICGILPIPSQLLSAFEERGLDNGHVALPALPPQSRLLVSNG